MLTKKVFFCCICNGLFHGRYQRVKIGSLFSQWVELLLGIPQGSILGPLLFNIFINDFLMFMHRTDVCNYADDNTLYSCSSNLDAVISDLELDMESALAWFKVNQLAANPSKFKLMFLGVNPGKLGLFINNEFVKPSASVKLFGVNIDCNLNFTEHINSLCIIANKKLSCLYRIRN